MHFWKIVLWVANFYRLHVHTFKGFYVPCTTPPSHISTNESMFEIQMTNVCVGGGGGVGGGVINQNKKFGSAAGRERVV